MKTLSLYFVIASLAFAGASDIKPETVAPNLKATVNYLSVDIGERSWSDLKKLGRAADSIEDKFRSSGCPVKRQAFFYSGNTYYNIIAEVKGAGVADDGILIIGAHYDTVKGTPGADDNASGVAALLELARLTALQPAKRTVRFVAFSLEEPPVFGTEYMGSYVYAKSVKEEGVKVYGMISLEMVGYFCDEKYCQQFPLSCIGWAYPDRGNYLAFVGNNASRSFTKKVRKAFARASSLPVESLNTFSSITGVDFSDHRNFWKFGFPAFMISDTAFYRNHRYHQAQDTAETLDYGRMGDLVVGLYQSLGVL
ncbi:MAG: M28 family peptidase [Nitrospirota bacterium]